MPEVPNTSETWAIVKEELEVLEAIWGEDMEDRGRLRGLPKTAFQVNAKAALIRRKDDGQIKAPPFSVPSVTLLVSFMRGYPRVPPELSIEASTGLTDHNVIGLLSSLVEEANQQSKWRCLNGGEANIGFIYDLLVILQACVSEEAEKQEKASNKSKSLYERAVESADHEKVEQMRLREAEMEKERAMEEERLREEEKKKTDIQVEAEAGRRLQQEALKPLFDSDSNHERIWHQQEDFESDADSQTSMDIGGKAEWSARSGMGSSWFTRQFKEIGVVGRGGFGTVVKVRNRVDKRFYAIKMIPLDATDTETNRRIHREVTTISRMHHTNIVRYYHAVVEYEEGEEARDHPLQNELDEEDDTSDPEGEMHDYSVNFDQYPSVGSAGVDFEAEGEDDVGGDMGCVREETTGSQEGTHHLHTRRCFTDDDHYVSNLADRRSLEVSSGMKFRMRETAARLKEDEDGTAAELFPPSCYGEESVGEGVKDDPSCDAAFTWSDGDLEKPTPTAKVLSPREFVYYCKDEASFVDNNDLQPALGVSWSSEDALQEYFGSMRLSNEFSGHVDERERKEERQEALNNYVDTEEEEPPPHDLHILDGVQSVTTTKHPGRRVLMIQMEYCHQTLRSVLDTTGLMERDMWRIFRELLDSVEFIHSKGVIHRDIKPENVFFDQEGVVKLGDFGLATAAAGPIPGDFMGKAEGDITHKSGEGEKIGPFHVHDKPLSSPLGGGTSSSQMSGGVGTLFYRAPEQERARGKYSYPADMFSLGVVLFEMHMEPFRTKMERSKVMSALRDRGKCPSVFEDRVTLSAQKIIEWLMQHDPAERPSAKELQSSPLLPPKMEVERAYLRETLNSIRHMQSASFSLIVKAIHGRHNPEHVEYTFDQDRINYIAEGQGPIVSSCATALYSTMRMVFEAHGAIPLSPPTLLPKRQPPSNGVQLLDKGGQLLMLPSDLTFPFARYIARKGVYNVKRYQFGIVYRPVEPDQHPHEMEEVDFDAVIALSPISSSSNMVVAEAVLVAAQILSAYREELGPWTLRIGDGRLAAAILELNKGTETTTSRASAVRSSPASEAAANSEYLASRLSRAWSLQVLTDGKCTPRALNAALGTRIASDEKLMHCLRPLLGMGMAVAVGGMTSPDEAILELQKAVKGLSIVRNLDRSGDVIEKNSIVTSDESLARTTAQLTADDKCGEDDLSSTTGVRERQRRALAHVVNSLQGIKDVLRCLRRIGLLDSRAGGSHPRKRRSQKKRGGVVASSSTEGLGGENNIYSEALQLKSSDTLSPVHIVFDPGLGVQNGPYGESLIFQATLARGVVMKDSSSNVSGGGGSSSRNDVSVLYDVNARSVAEGGRYEKTIERQRIGMLSKDIQLVAVGVRFAAERMYACIARKRLEERDRLGPRAPPASLDPTRCPLSVLVCSEVDGLGTISMDDRAIVAFHLQVTGLRVDYMARDYLLSGLGGGSTGERSATVEDLRLFSFSQLLKLCTRVKIPVVVAISEHNLHNRGLVKIIYIFDSSSTASFNNSADSNLISLREASDHIMKHLNQLSLPTISSKSPANNDTGSWRSSSAEPSNAAFNEDLVKVLGEQVSGSSKRHAFKQKSHTLKRIRAILEGINHAGLPRKMPTVLVSELSFAAVRELCTSFVLSGGSGTPTLPSHPTYSTKHVKLLLEALTESEREAKIDARASRIIYIYSLPDSLIDTVTFSATS